MTDVQNESTAAPDTDKLIESARKQADLLGIAYKSNTSLATLQKNIKEKLESTEVGAEEEKPAATEGTETKAATAKTDPAEAAFQEAMKLVRVIITPLESTKASNLDQDIFCAGNSVVGTVRRTIPFGVEWHVEQILLNSIREKKYQMFITKRNAAGADVTTSRLVPAYNIAVLDDLTDEELKELADRQVRSGSLVDE